ncbi:hypothetical protein Hypma_013722 [Hypsizygus marmoreus]|uniref:N-terminal of MaoC-like dehydratase domain-containing protein n=1 Tax=Hypsizygus marmoreus TaxID=39966 RepID=A0A369JIP1_HYPMA|nr:hypothetical protein Hypma_013722 [Hypsizygus marmoreus]
MFKDRRDECEVQNDILQENFINATAGWINLLLLSSSGPVKIPAGACATALQSLDIACDFILSGKAKLIFPAVIDGNHLKLVHLSNGFRKVDGVKPLQVGDICKAEARIASVTNANEGKIADVKGYVYRAGEKVIEVVSAFLYRARVAGYQNTFETTEEPDYNVFLKPMLLSVFFSRRSDSNSLRRSPCWLEPR